MQSTSDIDLDQGIVDVVAVHERRLRQAFTALWGPQRGREVAVDALSFCRADWDEVRSMDDPVGYLYAVGRERAFDQHSWQREQPTADFTSPCPDGSPWCEPALAMLLGELSEPQRQIVLLVYASLWTPAEVAELLEVPEGTVQRHAARALAELRAGTAGAVVNVEAQLEQLGERLDGAQAPIGSDEMTTIRGPVHPVDEAGALRVGARPSRIRSDEDGATPVPGSPVGTVGDVDDDPPRHGDGEHGLWLRLDEPPRRQRRSEQRGERRSRWWPAAAAVVALAAVATIVTVSLDGETAPEDAAPSQITTPDPVPASSRTVVESFIAALNDRDVDAAIGLAAPGTPIAVAPVGPTEAVMKGVTLGEQIAWLAAWDWRWEDVECSRGDRLPEPRAEQPASGSEPGAYNALVRFDARSTCRVVARTKLGDLDDAWIRHVINFRLLDGNVTFVNSNPGFPSWMPSFSDFVEWAETERSDLWAQAWNDDGPLLTTESAEIEGQLLDEFVELVRRDGDSPVSEPDVARGRPSSDALGVTR